MNRIWSPGFRWGRNFSMRGMRSRETVVQYTSNPYKWISHAPELTPDMVVSVFYLLGHDHHVSAKDSCVDRGSGYLPAHKGSRRSSHFCQLHRETSSIDAQLR